MSGGALALLLGSGCDPDSGGRGSVGGGIDIADGDDEGGAPAPDDEPDAPASDTPDDDTPDDDDDTPEPSGPAPEVPFDPGKLAEVCARGNADRVAQALCGGAQIGSIADLRNALDFQSPFFALSANSTSLVANHVSSINPRLIVGDRIGQFGAEPFGGGDLGVLAMGFARGEQFVELVGFDPVADELNFYLLMFEQECNATEQGCSTADLVTPAIEEDWDRWTLYQDVDLENKTLDCNVCHQPLGPGTPKILRTQEISNSWTHWFPVRPVTEETGPWPTGGDGTDGIRPTDEGSHGTRSSEVLWTQFERMHAAEGFYGGVSLDLLRLAAAGPEIEVFVRSYMATRELPAALQVPHGAGAAVSDYFCDSSSMEIFGAESAWDQEFSRVVHGTRLPLPSHRIDITDAARREAAIASYLDKIEGVAPEETLVDPRDVVADDTLVEMSLLPTADATATEILTHMCSRCHNDRLDPGLSRARFDATALASLTHDQKLMIADRIGRGHDDKYLMPPSRFASLPDWAVDRVVTWLEL
ncbi:MAG: hypothetical protein AAF721_39750 [Myxococcota bacterium]